MEQWNRKYPYIIKENYALFKNLKSSLFHSKQNILENHPSCILMEYNSLILWISKWVLGFIVMYIGSSWTSLFSESYSINIFCFNLMYMFTEKFPINKALGIC